MGHNSSKNVSTACYLPSTFSCRFRKMPTDHPQWLNFHRLLATSAAYAGAHSATMAPNWVCENGWFFVGSTVSHVCTSTTARETNVWAKRKHPNSRKLVCILITQQCLLTMAGFVFSSKFCLWMEFTKSSDTTHTRAHARTHAQSGRKEMRPLYTMPYRFLPPPLPLQN